MRRRAARGDAAGWRGFGERLAAVGDTRQEGRLRLRLAQSRFRVQAARRRLGAAGAHPRRPRPTSAGRWTSPGSYAAAPIRCTWIDRHGKRIVAVHVKDIAKPGEGKDEDGWSDVGHGTIDWAGLIKALRAKTPAKYFVMEQDNPNDIERFARRSIESVKNLTASTDQAFPGAIDMARKLGVGIIGCGNISTTYFSLSPLFKGIEVRACADINPAAAKAKAKEYGVRAESVERSAQGQGYRHRRQPDHPGGPLRGIACRCSTPASTSIRKSPSCCRSRKGST